MGNEVYNEELFIGLSIVLFVIWLAAIGLSIAGYVLRGIGLYDLARKRKVRGAWTAWVPGCWVWALGAVVDNFAADKGIRRRFRWLMVLLYGAIILCYVAMFVVMLVGAFSLDAMEYPTQEAALAMMGGVFAVYIPMVLALMAFIAVCPVCYYKVFEETVPEKAVKYLLLSYLVPLAFGICLMRCARAAAVPVPAIEAAAPEAEFVSCDPFADTGEE